MITVYQLNTLCVALLEQMSLNLKFEVCQKPQAMLLNCKEVSRDIETKHYLHMNELVLFAF